jgi:ribosomal protein L31
MKTILSAVLILVSIHSQAQTVTDTMAIKETVLNYIEGFYASDQERMTKAIHPELSKRLIVKDSTGNTMLQNTGSSQLIYSTKRNRNTMTLNPGKPFLAEVIIYDIYNNVATVKVTTNKFKFIDYLHLGKFNGEWKIVNVLWEYLK